MTTIDYTECEKQGAHIANGDHSVQQCPIYRDAKAVMEQRTPVARKIPDDIASYSAQRYERTAKDIAQTLRDLAGEFEQKALDESIGFSNANGARTYRASRAIENVHWGIANAKLGTLIRDAAEADRFEREAKS